MIGALLAAALKTAVAQKSDMALVIVHYKFTHVRDTMNRAHPYVENMALYIGKSASAYKSYDALAAYARFKKAYAEALANSTDGHVEVRTVDAGSRTEYYQFPNENKFFTKDKLAMNTYQFEKQMPVIRWKIGRDTTSFGQLHCQKATCHFKGRDYIAWFCPELPVHTGPWKLSGLPGVIVDAHDVKNEVIFKFDGVEKAIARQPLKGLSAAHIPPMFQDLDDNPNLIEPPGKAIKTTPETFARLEITMYKDPEAFAQMQTAQQNANGVKGDHIRFKAAPLPVMNNPIELPDKK
jgi:GLPGLI family protein